MVGGRNVSALIDIRNMHRCMMFFLLAEISRYAELSTLHRLQIDRGCSRVRFTKGIKIRRDNVSTWLKIRLEREFDWLYFSRPTFTDIAIKNHSHVFFSLAEMSAGVKVSVFMGASRIGR